MSSSCLSIHTRKCQCFFHSQVPFEEGWVKVRGFSLNITKEDLIQFFQVTKWSCIILWSLLPLPELVPSFATVVPHSLPSL